MHLAFIVIFGALTLAAEAWFLSAPDWEPALTALAMFASYLYAVREYVQHPRSPIEHAPSDRVPSDAPLSSPADTEAQEADHVQEALGQVYVTVRRFREVFREHGVELTQVPLLVHTTPPLRLADLRNDDTLLQRLDEDMLRQAVEAFGVRRQWLDGQDNQIFPPRNYYKNVHRFIDLVCELKNRFGQLKIAAFKDAAMLDAQSKENIRVALLVSAPFTSVNGSAIYRYYPDSSEWLWNHWRSRYELKAIFALLARMRIPVEGRDLNTDELSRLRAGIEFPLPLLRGISMGYTWYPEDYIEGFGGPANKETEEVAQVDDYIREHKYFEYLQSCDC